MAHFAEIDENNIVLRVIVVNNSDCGGGNFPESEPLGQEYISSIGLDGNWLQTSYNHNFRKQYACIEFKYDEQGDVFIKPQPYPSWNLNQNYDWEPPIPMPETDGLWEWNEEQQQWEEFAE